VSFLEAYLPTKVTLPSPLKVLDIGSGTGELLIHLSAALSATKCWGVEIRPELVEKSHLLINLAKSQFLRFELEFPVTETYNGDFWTCLQTKEIIEQQTNFIICNNFSFADDQSDGSEFDPPYFVGADMCVYSRIDNRMLKPSH
jgi:tRNA1(Val) A37 N6-methylase TrmN6